MDYILWYGKQTSCNFVYKMILIYFIYPIIMTEVNVSVTVEEMSATMEKLNMFLENLRVEIFIYNSA